MFIILLMFLLSLMFSADACTASQWKCTNGVCIANSRRCDNLPDCSDASDEQNCAFLTNCPEGLESCLQSNGSVTCVDKATGCSCGSLPVVENGIAVLRNNTSVGFVADLVCNEGYEASKSTIRCKFSGHWEQAVCTDIVTTTPACDITQNKKSSTDTILVIVIIVLAVVYVIQVILLIVGQCKILHKPGNEKEAKKSKRVRMLIVGCFPFIGYVVVVLSLRKFCKGISEQNITEQNKGTKVAQDNAEGSEEPKNKQSDGEQAL